MLQLESVHTSGAFSQAIQVADRRREVQMDARPGQGEVDKLGPDKPDKAGTKLEKSVMKGSGLITAIAQFEGQKQIPMPGQPFGNPAMINTLVSVEYPPPGGGSESSTGHCRRIRYAICSGIHGRAVGFPSVGHPRDFACRTLFTAPVVWPSTGG
jgi:hypothetical protein